MSSVFLLSQGKLVSERAPVNLSYSAWNSPKTVQVRKSGSTELKYCSCALNEDAISAPLYDHMFESDSGRVRMF